MNIILKFVLINKKSFKKIYNNINIWNLNIKYIVFYIISNKN